MAGNKAGTESERAKIDGLIYMFYKIRGTRGQGRG